MDDRKATVIAAFIWVAGAIGLYLLWGARLFTHDFAESLFGGALYVAAFFYPFTFPWIRDRVRGRPPTT